MLFPIHNLVLPAERDLSFGDVRFFRMSDQMRAQYLDEFSRVVRTTHLASGADPARSHALLESSTEQILRASEHWAEVAIATRSQSASWLARYKLRSALSVLSLMLPSVNHNPELSAVLRWATPSGPATGHLVLSADQEFVQSWERVPLRVPVQLSVGDVEKLEADELCNKAIALVFMEQPTDLDVRVCNAVRLLAQAYDEDEPESKLPIYGIILETLLRTKSEQRIRATVRERARLLLKPRDPQAFGEMVDRVYNARSEFVHVRGDQFARQEAWALRMIREGRTLAVLTIVAALQWWSPNTSFARFLQALRQGNV